MKQLKCNQLGGPGECEFVVSGETFMEVGKACQVHAMEQVQAGDEPHKKAMEAMMQASPDKQQEMMASYEQIFNSTPNI